jgi:hypothetical protein
VVFYDDGMAVAKDFDSLSYESQIIHSDLVNAGLIPGVGKCIWIPVQQINWNGLHFDFIKRGISVLPHRITKTLDNINMI